MGRQKPKRRKNAGPRFSDSVESLFGLMKIFVFSSLSSRGQNDQETKAPLSSSRPAKVIVTETRKALTELLTFLCLSLCYLDLLASFGGDFLPFLETANGDGKFAHKSLGRKQLLLPSSPPPIKTHFTNNI